MWRRKASRTFPRLQSDPKAEGRRKLMGEILFVRECRAALCNLPGSSDLSRPRKELYRELVVGSASKPLREWRGWTAEEIRSHRNWAPGLSFLNNFEFSLTWRLARNALPLLGLDFRASLANIPDCARCGSGLEETAEHEFYFCEPFFSILGSNQGVDASYRSQAAPRSSPLPLFLYLNPYSSPLLLKILEFQMYIIHINYLQSAQPWIFFPHYTRIPLPPRVGPVCFRCFRALENSQPLFRRLNQTGNFFFGFAFYCISGFFSQSHYISLWINL